MTINTNGEKIKIFLNSTELTQDSTPSPDSPVSVNVITGENIITLSNSDGTEEQNYPISLSSKNLFDFNKVVIGKLGTYGTVSVNNGVITFTANNQSVYGVEIDLASLSLKDNTTYTISNLFTNTGTFATNHGWRYYNGSTYTNFGGYEEEFTFTTTTSGVNKLYYYVGSPTTYTGTLTLSQIQLVEGSIAPTTYGAYYNIKYCKIGDYADQIFKNTTNSPYYDNTLIENEWYLKQKIEATTFNGTEVWNFAGSYYFWRSNSGMGAIEEACQKYSDRFIYSELGVSNAPTPSLCENDSTYPEFIFKTDGSCGTTANEWKSWLSENNVLVYYPKKTPTYIHISESDYPTLKTELDNLYNNAITYVGVTNITQTNNGLPFDITYELISNTEGKIRDVVYDINEFLRVNL